MPPAATDRRRRRPPLAFRSLRLWVQDRALGVIAALGEYVALFALVTLVILGAIFVLSNRVVTRQVLTPGVMSGSYAPDSRARYSADATGSAYAIPFVDGIPGRPIKIAEGETSLPPVRTNLAEDARTENRARDALASSGGGFHASNDTAAALAVPVITGKALSSLKARSGGGSGAPPVVQRGTASPTQAVSPPSPTKASTPSASGQGASGALPALPSVSPTVTRPPGPTATVNLRPFRSPTRSATPTLDTPVVTNEPDMLAPTVQPLVTAPRATGVAPTPTAPVVVAPEMSSTPDRTPVFPNLKTVVPEVFTQTVPPPSATAVRSRTPNASPTPVPLQSATVARTSTTVATPSPTATPPTSPAVSPTALAFIDLSKIVAAPGQTVVTSFAGIFSTEPSTDPATGITGAPGALDIAPGEGYLRTLLLINGGNKPIDFLTQTKVDLGHKDTPLWTDATTGLQMEVTINGALRYVGPLDTSRAATPPSLERLGANDLMSVGFRIYLPDTAGNDMARQDVEFNLEFVVTRY